MEPETYITIAIGAAVAVIGFLQWRTNHLRVVLDLFDRRMLVLDETRAVARQLFASGRVEEGDMARLHKAYGDSKFLFGDEVVRAIEKLIDDAIVVQTSIGRMEDLEIGPERSELAQQKWQAVARAQRFFTDISSLCVPYMKLTQKRVRTPVEWFKDKNRLRQTYGQE